MSGLMPTDVQPYVKSVHNRRRIDEALMLLLSAVDDAEELGIDQWQFAVEWPTLSTHGLTGADLRWLALKGLVHHAVEKSMGGDFERVFNHEVGPTTISSSTCVTLTPLGIKVARRLSGARKGGSAMKASSVRPVWNARLRELRVGGQLVKRFRVPAVNQQTVLMAFEEEGWPERIDDPLPSRSERTQRRALHDTVGALNRAQVHSLIRFGADGSGEGIRWEFVNESVLRPKSASL